MLTFMSHYVYMKICTYLYPNFNRAQHASALRLHVHSLSTFFSSVTLNFSSYSPLPPTLPLPCALSLSFSLSLSLSVSFSLSLSPSLSLPPFLSLFLFLSLSSSFSISLCLSISLSPLQHGSKMSPWHDIPLFPPRAPGLLNFVVEIPRGTATHCNTLQHTATYCNILQHNATQ